MRKGSKTVVIYMDVMERYYFFKRFFKPLSKNSNVCVITARLSISVLCKLQGIKVYLLRNIDTKKKSYDFLENSLSVLNNYHAKNEANIIYSMVQHQLILLKKEIDIESFFLWNGSTTIGICIGNFAKECDLKRYYFEISNLGKKIFVDKEGVNAQSYLYHHPDILDNVHINNESFKKWREHWKRDTESPKQVKNTTRIPFSFLIDLLGFYIFNILREDRRSSMNVMKRKFSLKCSFSSIDISNDLPSYFIFFAMQVTNDSQLLINSEINNLEALKIAKELSKKERVSLVVKLHPAEMNIPFIKSIEAMYRNKAFILSNLSTKELIEKSQKVIVINSTVGLEAMINEKELIVLGRALYKEFNFDRLKAYIFDYLVDIDYFDKEEKVSIATLKKILEKNV